METLLSRVSLISLSGAFLNLVIQLYLNNVTDIHQLTSHSTTSCPTTWRSNRDHRLLWRHFTLVNGKRDGHGATVPHHPSSAPMLFQYRFVYAPSHFSDVSATYAGRPDLGYLGEEKTVKQELKWQ